MRKLLTLLLSLFLLLVFSNFSLAQSNWQTLKTGAGGWMTGMHIHPSGNPVFARSDVGSAYRWDENTNSWTNIATSANIPSSDVYWNKFQGVLSIVSAPGDNQVAYLAYYDGIYRSTNQGTTWTKTNFPSMDMPANNDESKTSGERLSVDPLDDEVVYFATVNDGLYRTENGGTSWSKVMAIPEGTTDRGVRQLLYDESGGSVNGNTRNLFVTVDGAGVYQSTDAGTTWTLRPFGGTNPEFYDAEISSTGRLYVCGFDADSGAEFGVQEFDGTNWRQVFLNGTTIGDIALDPFNENRMYLFSYGFTETYRTLNVQANAPNWTLLSTQISASTIGWMNQTAFTWFVIGEAVFDPVVQDQIWIADGIGVWKTTDINDNEMTWFETAKNQEHLVSNDIAVLPDDKVVTAHWDRPLFYHDDLDAYPDQHQPSNRFNSAWDLDQSPDDPNFVVAIIEDHRFCCYDAETRYSGYSTDGGQTWTPFASMPDPINAQIYGYIAVAAGDNNNMVWVPTYNLNPYYTKDRGASWTEVALPGNSGNCCVSVNFFEREMLTADQVQPNTFYIYDWAEGHIFKSSDGGANWDRYANVLSTYAYNAKLLAVPGAANHLLFARGAEESLSLMDGVYRSTDGGQTWALLPNTDEVINIAVGKAAPGASYPTIFIQGRVAGEFGYFMSTDEGATWSALGAYPMGIYDAAKVMKGDLNVHGRLYVGFAGNGFVYYDAQAPLAVDWAEGLSGYATNKGNALRWSTSTEVDNDRFEVERSGDGKAFETIGRVGGNGNTTEAKTYRFLDSSPLKGITYYRLKQIDWNATFTYSNIISIYGKEGSDALQLYPNPAKSILTIDSKEALQSVVFYNAIGERVKEIQEPGKTINISNLPKGVYFLKIQLKFGDRSINQPLLIH